MKSPILFCLLAAVGLGSSEPQMKYSGSYRNSNCLQNIPPCDPSYPYRSHDGSCNNLAHPGWGGPNTTYSRLLPPRYADGIQTPRRAVDSSSLPSARSVRTSLFPTGQIEDDQRTLIVMQWGQMVTHDMSQFADHEGTSQCCSSSGKKLDNNETFCDPIDVSPADPTMGRAGIRCMKFTKSVTDKELGCSPGKKPAKQISGVTPSLDLSGVYGSSDEINLSLRTLQDGQMKTEIRNSVIYPPHEPNIKLNCPCNTNDENACYKTGGDFTNQNPQLIILQTILLRAHNSLAGALKGINPHWDDERLYQEARRINIAAYQHATYLEFLPSILGFKNLLDNKIIYPSGNFVDDYDQSVSPDVLNEHASGAYRHFHNQAAGLLQLVNADREIESEVQLSTWLLRPQILEMGKNFEKLTIGLVTQNAEATDKVFVKQVSDKLFACQGIGFGLDLKALDIQRDRDHALGYYNEYRRFCGLKVARSFDDYRDLISLQDIAKLKKLYKSYKDVDLSVGGSLEYPADGALVGPTFFCIMKEQFKRTRQADRFWYSSSKLGLTLEQLIEIEKSTVARLFCNEGDGIKEMQPDAFRVISDSNVRVPCSEIPAIDLTKWKE